MMVNYGSSLTRIVDAAMGRPVALSAAFLFSAPRWAGGRRGGGSALTALQSTSDMIRLVYVSPPNLRPVAPSAGLPLLPLARAVHVTAATA